MPIKFNYSLADSSQKVESSVSTDADDISRVTVKIRATYPLPAPPATPPAALTVSDVQRITFAMDQALTTTPDSITPGVSVFGKWGFSNMGNGVFEARPNAGTTVAAGETITFLLYDLEVALGDTSGAITITEFPSGEVSKLTVAKVKPELRIDEFRAEPPEIAVRQSAVLSWVTTAAEQVTISGPVVPAPQKDGVAITPTNVAGGTGTLSTGDKHGSLTVFPASTSVYTLKATGGGLIRTAQVIVTVRDSIQPADPTGVANLGKFVLAGAGAFPRLAVGTTPDLFISDRPRGSAQIDRLAVGDTPFASDTVSSIQSGDVQVQHRLGVGTAIPAASGDLAVEGKLTAGKADITDQLLAHFMRIGNASFKTSPPPLSDPDIQLDVEFDIQVGRFLRTGAWQVGSSHDDVGDFFFLWFVPSAISWSRIQIYTTGRIDLVVKADPNHLPTRRTILGV